MLLYFVLLSGCCSIFYYSTYGYAYAYGYGYGYAYGCFDCIQHYIL